MVTGKTFMLIVLAVFLGTLGALAIAGIFAKSQLQQTLQSNSILSKFF